MGSSLFLVCKPNEKRKNITLVDFGVFGMMFGTKKAKVKQYLLQSRSIKKTIGDGMAKNKGHGAKRVARQIN